MKVSQLPALKEALLAHKCDYTTKEYSKKAGYETDKKMILQRIEEIGKLYSKIDKYQSDIDEYLERLHKKHGLKVVIEGAEATVTTVPVEQDKKSESKA